MRMRTGCSTSGALLVLVAVGGSSGAFSAVCGAAPLCRPSPQQPQHPQHRDRELLFEFEFAEPMRMGEKTTRDGTRRVRCNSRATASGMSWYVSGAGSTGELHCGRRRGSVCAPSRTVRVQLQFGHTTCAAVRSAGRAALHHDHSIPFLLTTERKHPH